MALFVNGVPRRVLVSLLLIPLLLAVYLSNNKLTFRKASHDPDAELEMNNQDIKMVTKDFNELQMGVKTVQFDYYILELGYPPSICREQRFNNKCRTPWPTKFTIHGLWPSNKNPPDPENCPDGEDFDLAEIKRLVKDLNEYWPSLMKDTSNDQFWKYEWDKHGRCSNLGLVEYFKAGLKLYNDLKLSDKLKEIGVTPGNNYDPSDVVEKYGKKYKGIKPKIKCGKRTTTPLVEVMDKFQFKVKKNLKTIETMPSPFTNCQLNTVEFPK